MWLVGWRNQCLLLVITFNKLKLKIFNSTAYFSPQVLIFSLRYHIYSSDSQDMEYAAENKKTNVTNVFSYCKKREKNKTEYQIFLCL